MKKTDEFYPTPEDHSGTVLIIILILIGAAILFACLIGSRAVKPTASIAAELLGAIDTI